MLQVVIALDQLGNTLWPGGWADETISSRSYRMAATSGGWARMRRFVDWMALHIFRQANHCYEAYVSERQRTQEPPELRS